MNLITDQAKIRDLILSSNGKIFSVTFTKKDGSERHMVARLGVKSPLKGGDSTTAHLDYLITAFDMQKKAYRCINLSTVSSLKLMGEEYQVPEDLDKRESA